MRITWATRSFLDYRVPVYEALSELVSGDLSLVYYRDVVPDRVCNKIERALGGNSIGLSGEWRVTGAKCWSGGMANTGLRVPYQPGLIRTVKRTHPDVVISDGFFQWTYAALWLRATRGIPHVMCYERTAHTERNSQSYRTAYRRLVMRWIDAMSCTGRLCGEYAQSLGFPSNRLTYGHMVADVEEMRQAASCVSEAQLARLVARLGLKGLVFLYVGRLIPLKGIDKLLEAWKVFSSGMESGGATMLLVGDGPQRGELEQYCANYGLHHVRFAGAVDYDALAPFYRAADVFVIPTLEDNWSLVVPEAMACGLPILCSKYNGCWPEYVTPSNGWVFDPLDLRDMVGCLQACLTTREKLRQMGEESCRIVSDYTAKQAAEAVLRACGIALDRQRRT